MTFPRPARWKRQFQARNEFWTPRVSKTGPDRTMLGVVWVPRDSLFASACRGKGKFRALWECSRCLFTLPVEEKLISGFPMRPKSGPLGVIWIPCDCVFPLPVEAKAIAGSLGMLAMASFPCLSKKRRFQGSPRIRMMDASFDPLRLPFLPPCREKHLGQGSPGMLTIAFSPCLSRNL